MKISIIGSGLSGLTAAALLSKQGHSVTVFEQHKKVGGVTASIKKDGYTWDLGPMILPDLAEDEPGGLIFKKLGIESRVKTKQSYREYSFPDYRIKREKECTNPQWVKDKLKSIFPDESKGLDSYYRYHEKVMDINALQTKGGLFNIAKLLIKYFSLGKKKSWSAQDLVDYYFKDKKLKAFFISILADYVCSTSDFPGIAIPVINSTVEFDERTPLDFGNHEHRSSWRVIENGTITLVDALVDVIEDYGGKIITEAAVEKIRIEDGKAVGVEYNDGKNESCDIVIASGGLKNLFERMVGYEYLTDEFIEKHLADPSLTESVFMLNLGVDYDAAKLQNNSPICYYYNTYDVDNSIKECKEGIYHKGDDGFLVYIFSAHSKDMAPKGYQSMQVYTIAPNNPVNGDWEKNKEEWADHLLGLAEKHFPDLRKHIETKVILTPKDFQNRTHLDFHSFGGCTPNIHVSPPNHKTPIENLWFVGAQSNSFGGVTGAMTGADRVVIEILKEK